MKESCLKSVMRVTKALSDRQRLRILMLMAGGELCVCQIVEVMALAPSTISKHLSILNAAGLLDMRKEGRWAYYRRPAGSDAAFVRPVVKWLQGALEGDEVIAQDAVKRKRVLADHPSSLCLRQRGRKGRPRCMV